MRVSTSRDTGGTAGSPGWARRGSQLQVQLWVARRPSALSDAILSQLPALAGRAARLDWVSPCESDGFAEPRDLEFLKRLDLDYLWPSLKKFWPRRGPVWDALAKVQLVDGGQGALLVEAKSYPAEMYAGGIKASEPSRTQILTALAWAQGWLGAPCDPRRWADPLDPTRPGSSSLYQMANRLAHVAWLRSAGIEAWLCHLMITEDPTKNPTSLKEWRTALAAGRSELGLGALLPDYIAEVFVPGLAPTSA